ncbi:hydrolase 1, exosortase A system-associated [Pseudorhodoferax sp. Leaf274]|uniref:hydrolase 1, exosortase A system-associated n=1 Tax=Pseudorhodoferax sp. Leaf274 TaxID=1736318 RepID=UPI0007025A97|nr:hydrolase 1, exosortase A system-associated [Pseudorhodoferax sp. Leaf274]KQP39777.1 hypothetical protein ASF44_08605 [Pseudorhodoferax sp. Leaf274]
MTPANRYDETALGIDCAGELLQGVLATPPVGEPCRAVGLVVVVGGPQIRAGSHRQFVALARRLAAAGHAVLRFDVRGMGDSSGAPRGFESLQQDIDAGISALLRTPGVEKAVLWGLCDGASASLLYMDATGDDRVAGVALLNPWVRSEQSLAQTHVKHYYRARLVQSSFWLKLLRGEVGMHAMRDLLGNLLRLARRHRSTSAASFQQRMAAGWCAVRGHLLVLLSTEDWTAREFEEQFRQDRDWTAARNRPGVQWHRLTGADHTLASPAARQTAEEATLAWLQRLP